MKNLAGDFAVARHLATQSFELDDKDVSQIFQMIQLDGESSRALLAFDTIGASLLEGDLVHVQRFEELSHD